MNPPNWPAWHTETVERLDKLEGCQEQLMDVVAGEVQIDGTRANGLVHDVGWMKKEMQNGGLRTRLKTADRVALYAAIIGFFGTIIAAAVGLFG